MSSSNNNAIVSKASPHTIKKFELIESYVKSWAQKLMQNKYCNGIIFIDCMCNSGIYRDESGTEVFGTPIRVSRILRDVAGQYPNKKVYVYLNDNSEEIFCENWQNPVKQRITPHFLTTSPSNYYEFTTKE